MIKNKFKLNPINLERWKRFKANRRGYVCFWLFMLMTVISLFAEVFFNSRPLIVSYEGKWYYPFIQDVIPAKTFGMKGESETDYFELQEKFENDKSSNWVLFTLVPYDADHVTKIDPVPLDEKISAIDEKYKKQKTELNKNSASQDELLKTIYNLELKENLEKGKLEKLKYHPLPPDVTSKHYLGTDSNGRDIFARLFYGYRIAICFALVLLLVTYLIGVAIGCMMGYFGGVFDLIVQRKIEILSNIPFLYVIIIIAAVLRENNSEMGFWTLIGIYTIFGWMGMTWYMRTSTFKEKAREYVWAAKAIGASNTRIIFKHILPNVVSLLVTFIPFSISGSIVGLTSLDYLGYGLPKGTPSWGELIRLGTEDMDSYWIVLSVVSAMIIVLFLINSIGEAVREAFDPKKISRFE